jgi:hypothetical protein
MHLVQKPGHTHHRNFIPFGDLAKLTLATTQQRPHSYNNPGYLPNGAVGGHTGLPAGAAPLLPNNGRIIQTGGVRVLCVADVRGKLAELAVLKPD